MGLGAQTRGLRIAAKTQGWDPHKYPDGTPVPGMSGFEGEPDPAKGRYLPPSVPDGTGSPKDGLANEPTYQESVTWANPGPDTSNKRDGHGGSDPFPGMPM